MGGGRSCGRHLPSFARLKHSPPSGRERLPLKLAGIGDGPAGKLILLNGASSAGKSTLCRALQAQLEEPFLQFSLDFLMFGAPVLPRRQQEGGAFAWAAMRPRFFEGYFNGLRGWLDAGNNLVVDFIIETPVHLRQLVERLGGHDVFFVGVHCPPEELERREALRGDRPPGDARRDLETVHSFSPYDFEVDATRPAEENAARIIEAWRDRVRPGVLARQA